MSLENTPQLQIVNRFDRERKRSENISLRIPESLDFPEITNITEQIKKLTGTLNPVEIYTASNHAEEKKKFLTSFFNDEIPENPRFSYDVAENLDINETKENLQILRAEAMALAKQIKTETSLDSSNKEQKLKYLAALLTVLKIDDDLATCQMTEGIKSSNDALTKNALTKKYGRLDPALSEAANIIYKDKISPETNKKNNLMETSPVLSDEEQQWLLHEEFKADQIAEAFSWALEKYGFLAKKDGDFGFKVEISSSATSIDVRDKNQTSEPQIVIPRDRKIDGKKLLGLIGHEIECHVRQSMNGAKLFGLGGGALKIDGESPYEGLAEQADIKFNRDYFGEETAVPKPYYIKAIELAQSGKKFNEVFAEIMEMEKKAAGESENSEKTANSAWLTTYRVFRGSTDPDNRSAYAMPKDKAYLEGFIISKQLEDLGYDEYNQLAITTGAGLRLLGMFNVNKHDIPYPNLDLQREFWETKLKPKFLATKTAEY